MRKFLISSILISSLAVIQPTNGAITTHNGENQLKVGILKHDLSRIKGFRPRHERSYNVHLEYSFNNDYEFLWALPHVGASVNVDGYTSALYTGLTWHITMGKKFYLELTFGGAIHNANLKVERRRRALGSRLLFRESASLGFNINETHNISFIADHMSNAELAPPNHGLSDYGIRYGIKF